MKLLVLLFTLLTQLAFTSEIDLGFKKLSLPNDWVIKTTKTMTSNEMTLIFHKEDKNLLGKLIVLNVSKQKEITKNCPEKGEIINKKVCLVFIVDKKDKSKAMPFIHFIQSSPDNKRHKEITLAFDLTKNKDIYKDLANYLGSKI